MATARIEMQFAERLITALPSNPQQQQRQQQQQQRQHSQLQQHQQKQHMPEHRVERHSVLSSTGLLCSQFIIYQVDLLPFGKYPPL